MDNITHQEGRPPLVLTESAENLLIAASRWSTFLGVLSFVFAGIGVINSLVFIVGGAFISSMAHMEFSPVVLGVFGLLGVAIYGLIGYFLTSFGSKCKKALLNRNANDLELGMGHLKSHFMMMGILAIVFISIMIVAIVVAMAAGIMSAV